MISSNNGDTFVGIVVKKYSGHYDVRFNGQICPCTLSNKQKFQADDRKKRSRRGNFERALTGTETMIAVGDRVNFISTGTGGLIIAIQPRINYFIRRAAGGDMEPQIMAANIDQVMPVFALAQPEPKWNLLDRYLAIAVAQGIPARICITKIDLAEQSHEILQTLAAILDDYKKAGYPVHLISAQTGEGMEELSQALKDKKTVLLGKSGVGKSSLINSLVAGVRLKTGAVSTYHGKGRHVSTTSEMVMLENGGEVIDTPGTREFGLWGISKNDLELCFPEFTVYLGLCKFGYGCTHDEEPGCAVRQAVVEGEISPFRYQSYLKLWEEIQ